MTFYEIDILIIDVLIVWFVLAMFKPNLFAGFLPGNSRLRILIIFLTMLPPFLAGAFLLDPNCNNKLNTRRTFMQ